MSRTVFVVIVMTLLSYDDLAAQQQNSQNDISALIERQKKLVKIDRNGCIVDPDDDGTTIVVCGESEDNRRQKLPRGPIDTDRIRRGEAISTERAGEKDRSQCSAVGGPFGCIILPRNSVGGGFGFVPPPAIPLEEVLRGLPEPDMVVPEGSNVDPSKAPE